VRPRHSDVILTRMMSLHPKLIDLTLDRVWRLLAALDHPERALPPVIHVAGTNGKGSTVAMLRAGLEAAGGTVHAYTSPHLVRFHERIRLSGQLISEARLTEVLDECERANAGTPITYFEITTVAALLAFARNPADWCLLEVGLGGRLDATNVVDRPALTVITPISFDHQQFLGETLAEIAGEKAGILKPGVPCVVAPQPAEAMAVIAARARAVGAPLIRADRDWTIAPAPGGGLTFGDSGGTLALPRPRLPGGMLATKDAAAFLAPFPGRVDGVRAVTIPDEDAAAPAADLAATARTAGLPAEPAASPAAALAEIAAQEPGARVLICGSLYLAGRILRENG
jgi:dihydrofolate synthase/folylpolyglutamate synthase